MRPILFVLVLAAPLAAQSAPPFNFVMPHGSGRIVIDLGPGWEPQSAALLDNASRPTILITNKSNGLDLSYILFPNQTGGPTAESCRDAAVGPILQNLGASAVSNESRTIRKLPEGRSLATASYLIGKVGTVTLNQQNIFGFFGDKNTCAEIHLSKIRYTPADEKLFNAELDKFAFDATYAPNSQDYGAMATIYFQQTHDPRSAAVYYQTALDSLATPIGGYDVTTMRRVLTDQLSMSYGMSGDLKRSREVNEAAILKDPTYPLYYYNLACADAEAGNATAARGHLQQASDRRANTLKGEPFPDPSTDDSILKLKDNKAFWAFVQSLPKT